jgi:hypothetical protein
MPLVDRVAIYTRLDKSSPGLVLFGLAEMTSLRCIRPQAIGAISRHLRLPPGWPGIHLGA